MNKIKIGLLALAVSTSISIAQASTQDSAATSVVDQKQTLGQKIIKNSELRFVTELQGASISDPLSTNTPGGSPIYFASSLRPGYALTDSSRLEARINFNYRPVLGQEFTLTDPNLKYVVSNPISSKKISTYLNAGVRPAVTTASKDAGIVARFDTFHTVSYALSDRVSLGLWQNLEYKLRSSKAALGASEFAWYLAPLVEFKLTEKLYPYARVEFDTTAPQTNGDAGLNDISTGFAAGMSWSVSKAVALDPYVWMPLNKVSVDTAQILLALSARLY